MIKFREMKQGKTERVKEFEALKQNLTQLFSPCNNLFVRNCLLSLEISRYKNASSIKCAFCPSENKYIIFSLTFASASNDFLCEEHRPTGDSECSAVPRLTPESY